MLCLNRVVKLKGLLSRTYQANQKSLEDSNTMKRAQMETAQELRNHKVREENERKSLEEDLRRQAIESAFQYDMEMIIQRAAEDVISQQGLWIQTQQQHSKKLKDLESENELLKELITSTEKDNLILNDQLNNYINQLEETNNKLNNITSIYHNTLEKYNQLNNLLEEETSARQDLEVGWRD